MKQRFSGIKRNGSSLIFHCTPFADTFYRSRLKMITKCLQNALSEVMDQTVCITVVETVWETLHVTEGPENVTLGAISDTLENCVKQV